MQTPADIFVQWLGSRARDCRIAIAVDGDSLLMDSGVLGKTAVSDELGRAWHPVVFRGDDLAFRLRFRSAREQGPVVIVLAGSRTETTHMEVFWIADILAMNEGGDPLDLSLPAFFRRICPKINFPAAPLRRYRDTLMERLETVPYAAAKIIERWGRPDDWGNGQIAALALLAGYPKLTLAEIWPDETHGDEFVAHGLRLLLGTPALVSDHTILREILNEAAQPQVRDSLSWFNLPPADLAGYLVLRLVADQYGLQNPTTQLIGLQVFDPQMDLSNLEPLAMRVINRLRSSADIWGRIEEVADAFLTPRRLDRVLESLTPGVPIQKRTEYVCRTNAVPLIAGRHVIHILNAFFTKPSSTPIDWVAELKYVTPESSRSSTTGSIAQSGLSLLRAIHRIERSLTTPLPAFQHPEALLEWYVESGHHGLELAVARASADLMACAEPDLVEVGQRYLFGEAGDTDPAPDSLRGRVCERLHQIDGLLADMIRPNPKSFMQGPRSAASLIHEKLGDCLSHVPLGNMDGRLWILVFDGMRYDTWDEVIRPILSAHFAVDVQPFFALLPTFTLHARSGLLGGCLPCQGTNRQGEATANEVILVAKVLGLSQEEAKTRLRLVTDADTTAALMRIGFKDKDVREINVLIYSVSDDCHDFSGDLAAFNHRIRAAILGDKTQGARGILDDLLARIRPEDTVLLTSDHGFVELLKSRAIPVTLDDGSSSGDGKDVQTRYISGTKGIGKSPLLIQTGNQTYQLAVGYEWFKRESTRASPRYNHGGCSMAEMVIPGALMRRLTGKDCRLALENIPSHITVEEDATTDVVLTLRNAGNVDMSVSLGVQDSLGNVLAKQDAQLSVGRKLTITSQVAGRYRQTAARERDPQGTVTSVSIRIQHTDQDGRMKDFEDGTVVIPVRVKPKPTRLETDALKSFDDM